MKKRADLAKEGFEKALGNMRELAEMVREVGDPLIGQKVPIDRLPDGRVVPMCSLFCAVAGGAREALRDLLANERDHPCTDAELADALADRGYAVARRTVAKYRAELRVLRRALR